MAQTFGIITVDGPAASGKSSVARLVASRLNIPYVSSGLLYRVATLLVLKAGVDPDDAAAVLDLVGRSDVRLVPGVDGNRVFVDGEDLGAELHTDAVDGSVSRVARHGLLRSWVAESLRDLPGTFVAEGRDMGTAVFPHARWKFYLLAPAEVRAARRVLEREADLAEVTAAIRRRDELDAAQSVPARDAVFIDTTRLALEQVVDEIIGHLSGEAV